MFNAQNPNIELLLLAVHQLGDLVDEMVFLGGCATGLLLTDGAAPPIRVTKDVDAIVQVTTKAEYYKLSERLRQKVSWRIRVKVHHCADGLQRKSR